LSPDDKDLMWIPKQALETPIPAPWVECQTEAGDVFHYNSKTKESIWDHPFDSFYKRAIGKYKAGECTEEELTALLSEDWLQGGIDHRISSLDDNPQIIMEVNTVSSSRRRSLEGSLKSDSPRLVVTLPADPVPVFSPPESSSPSGARRRPSFTASDNGKEPQRKYPTGPAVSESEELKASHAKEIEQLTSDLLKASEYIEVLRNDNRSMRTRMNEAAVRAKDLQKDYLVTKQKLSDETKKLDVAEQVIRKLEMRLLQYEDPDSPTAAAHAKSQHLLARLCGSSSSAVRRRPPTRTSPSISRNQSRAVTQSPPQSSRESDPYKDLMQLLSSPPPSPVKP
jgi:hypothetical protein